MGIPARLIADTVSAVARKGCGFVEAMGDIPIKDAHNAVRERKSARTGHHRCARKVGAED